MKPAIGFVPGSLGVTPSVFWPPVDDSGEFKVEDILNSYFVHRGWLLVGKFIVKWRGNNLFEATWEALAYLTNCPDVLSFFC